MSASGWTTVTRARCATLTVAWPPGMGTCVAILAMMLPATGAALADDPGAADLMPESVSLTCTGSTKVTPLDATAYGYFGTSVSVSGDTAVIGAWGDGDAADDAGAAYIYRIDGGEWIREAKLIGSFPTEGRRFGIAVSIDGDTAVIGASHDDDVDNNAGSAYVFRRDANGTPSDRTDDSWVEMAKLTASDAAASDLFGSAVAVSGDSVVVGAIRGGGGA